MNQDLRRHPVMLIPPPLLFVAVFLLGRAAHALVPHGRARELVTGGTYRLTRNPMYAGLTLVYLGAAALLNLLWPVLLLPVPLLVLDRVFIPFEERRMDELFGESYAAYRRRVRRWV